jgi:hypothetical protein
MPISEKLIIFKLGLRSGKKTSGLTWLFIIRSSGIDDYSHCVRLEINPVDSIGRSPI